MRWIPSLQTLSVRQGRNVLQVSARALFCSRAGRLPLDDRPHLAAGWDPGPRDGFSSDEITEMKPFFQVASTCAVERWSCAQSRGDSEKVRLVSRRTQLDNLL